MCPCFGAGQDSSRTQTCPWSQEDNPGADSLSQVQRESEEEGTRPPGLKDGQASKHKVRASKHRDPRALSLGQKASTPASVRDSGVPPHTAPGQAHRLTIRKGGREDAFRKEA